MCVSVSVYSDVHVTCYAGKKKREKGGNPPSQIWDFFIGENTPLGESLDSVLHPNSVHSYESGTAMQVATLKCVFFLYCPCLSW